MNEEFTHPLARREQYRVIMDHIEQDQPFVHMAFLPSLILMTLMTDEIVLLKGEYGITTEDQNPKLLFYCNQNGRQQLKSVFAQMNRRLTPQERFRNQLVEGLISHEVTGPPMTGQTLLVHYVMWSYNHDYASAESSNTIIALFCNTLLDTLGVHRPR